MYVYMYSYNPIGHHVGGRKRKAKATVHILPSLTPGPVPPLTMGAPGINAGGTTALGAEPTGNTTGGGTSSAPTLSKGKHTCTCT